MLFTKRFFAFLIGAFFITSIFSTPFLAHASAGVSSYKTLKKTMEKMKNIQTGEIDTQILFTNIDEEVFEMNIEGAFDLSTKVSDMHLSFENQEFDFCHIDSVIEEKSVYFKTVCPFLHITDDTWFLVDDQYVEVTQDVFELNNLFAQFKTFVNDNVITFENFVFDSLETKHDVYKIDYIFHVDRYLDDSVSDLPVITGSFYIGRYDSMVKKVDIHAEYEEEVLEIVMTLSHINQPVDIYVPENAELFHVDHFDHIEIVPIDTDNDGLSDKDEFMYRTSIVNPDTDGDGYPDGLEVENGYNPLGEGKIDQLDIDLDGLSDEDEFFYGTDFKNPDTDGDGYLDGLEIENGYNPLGEGKL